jgi:hypothetical protein
MAFSKCPNCNSTSFELKETAPKGSRYKMFFIQCSSCGNPVSATDYENTNYKIGKLEENMEQRFSALQSNLNAANQNITTLMRMIQQLENKK